MKECIKLNILEEEQKRTTGHIKNLQVNLEQVKNSISKWKKFTLIGVGGTALFFPHNSIVATGLLLLTLSSLFAVQKRLEEKKYVEDLIEEQNLWLKKLQQQVSKIKMNVSASSNRSLIVDTKEFQDYDFDTFMTLLFPNLDRQKFQNASVPALIGAVDMSIAPIYIKNRLKERILLKKGDFIKS